MNTLDYPTVMASRVDDVAAMFLSPQADVTDAVIAALLGEYELIRFYGVRMDTAMVDAKAAELGVGLDEARYVLIMEQTATAEGFAS